MSEPKMQIKVKSHDYTEFETEVSSVKGKLLIGHLKNHSKLKLRSNTDQLKVVRKVLKEALYTSMKDSDRELCLESSIGALNKLIDELEGAGE